MRRALALSVLLVVGCDKPKPAPAPPAEDAAAPIATMSAAPPEALRLAMNMRIVKAGAEQRAVVTATNGTGRAIARSARIVVLEGGETKREAPCVDAQDERGSEALEPGATLTCATKDAFADLPPNGDVVLEVVPAPPSIFVKKAIALKGAASPLKDGKITVSGSVARQELGPKLEEAYVAVVVRDTKGATLWTESRMMETLATKDAGAGDVSFRFELAAPEGATEATPVAYRYFVRRAVQ